MIINPFLLAGKDQIEEYQKQRVRDWEKAKGDDEIDFDHYFEKINMWDGYKSHDFSVEEEYLQSLENVNFIN